MPTADYRLFIVPVNFPFNKLCYNLIVHVNEEVCSYGNTQAAFFSLVPLLLQLDPGHQQPGSCYSVVQVSATDPA